MHVEIQVALNFLISFLYNKLPRRRVNQFGEELENALKMKFEGHWYPEKPYKGSAFRCLKTTPPLDPVFEIAAREAGMDLSDIQENLAPELSIWIDPGEVSYRMSEKGPVKILYSESDRILDPDNPDGREVTRTFNPEAQCFKPIDANGLANSFGSLSMSTGLNNATNGCAPSHSISPSGVSSAPVIPFGGSSPIYKANGSGSTGGSGFISKSSNPVTFTTATFAQTKFGSTKLKTNGKRSHRMSPTEFSNYIKQRAMIQQQQAAAAVAAVAGVSSPSSAGIGGGSHNGGMIVNSGTNCGTNGFSNGSPHASRSISPVTSPLDSMSNFMLLAAATGDSSGLNPSGGHHQQQQQPQHHSHNHHQQSATQSSSVAASGYPPGNQYSGRMVSSPISSRNPFSNAMFDNNCLIDLLGTSIAKSGNQPQQQQQPQQGSALNRFASFLDKAGPYVGTNSSGAASPPHTSVSSASSALANSLLIGNGLSGSGSVLGSGYGGYNDESPTSTSPNLLNNNNHSHNNAAKNGSSSPPSDSFTFNLNSVSYPNQYQHLLMAN